MVGRRPDLVKRAPEPALSDQASPRRRAKSAAPRNQAPCMNARFSLGIDLGTSNSAIAIADVETDRTRIVEIAQIMGPNQVGETPMLASALYVPHGEEFP